MAELKFDIDKMMKGFIDTATKQGLFVEKWIPVSERLPEDGQEILFSTRTGRVYSGKYHDDNSANQWYSYRDKCNAWNNVVTAWMPLPKPYKTESEGKNE